MIKKSAIHNPLFEKALHRIPQNRPPIWFMRQAGRYHKHYQGLRQKYSFLELCQLPEVAAEVALGPIAEFDFDVAILFSDILFPLPALGIGLNYSDQHGPQLDFQLNSKTIMTLRSPDLAFEKLQFQADALRATRARLPKDKSLIGFVGGPWTLFAYAVEGSHKGGLQVAKSQYGLLNSFFEILLPLLKMNIRLQLDAGAEIVMIFDTAVGELSPGVFKSWISPVLLDLCKEFPNRLGYYSKSTQQSFFDKDFINAPWAGFGFDHRWSYPQDQIFSWTNHGFLQGNFDQALLFLEPSQFKIELLNYLKPFRTLSAKDRAGWVCGLGHGVLPKTPEANVHTFIETVREAFS